MSTPLADYTADHRLLIEAAGRAAGLSDPVAFDPSSYALALLGAAIRGPLVPLDGALVRDWMTGARKYWVGASFGARLYTADGIHFVHVSATVNQAHAPG